LVPEPISLFNNMAFAATVPLGCALTTGAEHESASGSALVERGDRNGRGPGRLLVDWREMVCAENVHRYFEKDERVPVADKPDF
jgi:hypothetical protein